MAADAYCFTSRAWPWQHRTDPYPQPSTLAPAAAAPTAPRQAQPGGATPLEMFRLLNQHVPAASPPTRGLLLTAALKLLLQSPGDAALKREVTAALEKAARGADAELQQRAVEYLVGAPPRLRTLTPRSILFALASARAGLFAAPRPGGRAARRTAGRQPPCCVLQVPLELRQDV
jgi:hypothetical protein